MKYPLIIITIFFGTLSATAQIERKTEISKPDSSNAVAGKNKDIKQTQKDRFKELDLTKEQKAKVKEIRHAGKSAKEAIENNAELNEADKKRQLRLLQRDQMQKIQGILTEEQKAKFKASKENNT